MKRKIYSPTLHVQYITEKAVTQFVHVRTYIHMYVYVHYLSPQ